MFLSVTPVDLTDIIDIFLDNINSGSLSQQWTYSLSSYFSMILFSSVVSYGIAFLSYLFLEKPLMNVEMLITSLLSPAQNRWKD